MPYTKDVLIGAPDQAGATGAILHADVGTTLPTIANVFSPDAAWRSNFDGNEYVSEDGLTLAPSISTNEIKDWSGAEEYSLHSMERSRGRCFPQMKRL